MVSEEAKIKITALCPDVERKLAANFFARMDDDYFANFSAEEICTHMRMAGRLSLAEPAQVQIAEQPHSAADFKVVIVGFDYLSEFSIFCGLLSAFGLDIQSGEIYSFGNQSGVTSQRKIVVDVFDVRSSTQVPFDAASQSAFAGEIHRFARLLATGDIQEPRERLNRFLVERLERMDEPLSGLISPVEIRFDNELSADWTVMETLSHDAFALLYAVSNALAMRGVYIHKVKIRKDDAQANDVFFLADRWGRKIQSAQERERLRISINMFKQFTGSLPAAPDPAKAMRHFDQFLDRLADQDYPDHVISFLAKTDGMNVLAQLLGSSDYLWDDFLGTRFGYLVPILENLPRMPLLPESSKLRRDVEVASTIGEKKTALNQFKDAELFRIDAKHLLDPHVTLVQFSEALTVLAEIVLNEAASICYAELGGSPGPFAICGLGKFGGREMGYASDLELVFVHESAAVTASFELLVRRITEFLESRKGGIFHIDLRLRPYGDAGVWSIPFDEFANYYSANGDAAAFERQALIKLRWVGGDEALGRRVEAHRDTFTYSGAPWDSDNALHLRRRQMRELVKPGDTNVKYSAGGIVDIEYAVQYLQLIHGPAHQSLRVTGTLDALQQLRQFEILGDEEHRELHSAYLFFRNVIDALRIVRGDASDLVLPPEESEQFKSLARRLGYRERDRTKSAALLAADLRKTMSTVHAQFLARYNR